MKKKNRTCGRQAQLCYIGESNKQRERGQFSSVGNIMNEAREQTGNSARDLYLLCRTAGMQRLQMRFPGSNGNRVLISRIATPHTLHAKIYKTKRTRDKGRRGKKQKKNKPIEEKKKQKQKKSRLVTKLQRFFFRSEQASIHASGQGL